MEQQIAERATQIPAARLGTKEEFGPMAAFLASDHAAYTTGTIIRIDGGIVRGF